MAFVAILGCDGCGKTSVIEAIEAECQRRGVPVRRGHWRPGTGKAPSGAADDPHGQSPRGSLMSLLKLGWLGWNWWRGWFGGLRSASARGLVLFDRYHADLLVDPRRYRYGGPLSLARLACRAMPQPDRVIYLDAPVEVLLSRKQEVGANALEQSRRGYLDLCQGHPRFRIIDASRPLAEVIADVVRVLPFHS